MKLKGHTTIELTDVNTGKKEVHEDDNLITNAISEILGYHGSCLLFSAYDVFASNDYSQFSPLLKLTGGLLLFDSAIEENPATLRAPAGVSLVGCASGISYNGVNTTAGSYNKAESGKVDNGYKHVWDFGTSQANGQIACACLTTMAGGKITSGSPIFYNDYMFKVGDSSDTSCETLFTSSRGNRYLTKCYGQSSINEYTIGSYLFADAKRNIIIKAKNPYWYYPTQASGIQKEQSIFYNKAIDLDIERLGFSTYSIFDTQNGSASLASTTPYGLSVKETVHVEMPANLKSKIADPVSNKNYGLDACCDEKYIYLVITLPERSYPDYYVFENEKIYIWKINTENFESTCIEVSNTVGEKIRADKTVQRGLASISGLSDFIVFDDYLLCRGESQKVYCISLSDNTNISTVKRTDGSILTKNDPFYASFYLCGEGKVCFSFSTTNVGYMYVFDPVLKIVKYKNINQSDLCGMIGSRAGSYVKVMCIANSHYLLSFYYTYNNNCYMTHFFDPSLLVTINNLSSPVLKTASQTMKVTYTLTLADA